MKIKFWFFKKYFKKKTTEGQPKFAIKQGRAGNSAEVQS